MRILLIGKYPPLQGGISSKTYWLYKALEKKGFQFRIITVSDPDYSIVSDCRSSNVVAIDQQKPPWHIPETSLLTDRLTNSVLKTAESFSPNIIEVNYLWPFANAGLLVSKMLSRPLLLRHAGSDIQKFQADGSFREIMRRYLRDASLVVTNITSAAFVEELAPASDKIRCLPRYVPDPRLFTNTDAQKDYDILFAGKINYYWQQKGIIQLLEVIQVRQIKALFHIGGKYVDQVLSLIASRKLSQFIQVRPFIPPDQMPTTYNSCRHVWCWQEEGAVEDFSNLVSEALFCGNQCLLHERLKNNSETKELMKIFPDRLRFLTTKNISDFDFVHPDAHQYDNTEEKFALFDEYIRKNIGVYEEVLQRKP